MVFVLVSFFVFILPRGEVNAASFTPRLTAPSSSDYHYTSDNPFYNSGYGMPNCTCYAWGRAYEILGSKPNLSTGNANTFYTVNQSRGAYNYGNRMKTERAPQFRKARQALRRSPRSARRRAAALRSENLRAKRYFPTQKLPNTLSSRSSAASSPSSDESAARASAMQAIVASLPAPASSEAAASSIAFPDSVRHSICRAVTA